MSCYFNHICLFGKLGMEPKPHACVPPSLSYSPACMPLTDVGANSLDRLSGLPPGKQVPGKLASDPEYSRRSVTSVRQMASTMYPGRMTEIVSSPLTLLSGCCASKQFFLNSRHKRSELWIPFNYLFKSTKSSLESLHWQ